MSTFSALLAMEYSLLGLELDDVLEGGPMPPENVAAREELETVPPLTRPHRKGTLFIDRLEGEHARRRFIGQGRRGRPRVSVPDEHDIAEARRCIEAAWSEAQRYHSAVAERVPAVQRGEIRARAIAEIRRAARWLDDIANRHDPLYEDDG